MEAALPLLLALHLAAVAPERGVVPDLLPEPKTVKGSPALASAN